MRIIVDTNIVFSTLLNSNSLIGDILFNSGDIFTFFSCNYMRSEIDEHWLKLRKLSKLQDSELYSSRERVLDKFLLSTKN